MEPEKLDFLTRLPALLNSDLNLEQVITATLRHLKRELDAEAATIFLVEPGCDELVFWALEGGDETAYLRNKRIPLTKGVVGWVIDRQESTLVNDVGRDPRFFAKVDKESGFITSSLICAPLTVGSQRRLGAIQVLNKINGKFSEDDLELLARVAPQISLSIENAKLVQELKAKSEQLALLDRRKAEMLTVITHEFHTPLGLIQSATELISGDYELDQQVKNQVFNVLLDGVHRLRRLIQDVRNVSKISSESNPLTLQSIVVQELLDELKLLFEEPLSKRKLTLSFEHTSDDIRVLADKFQLLLVMQNLISNAIRFTQDGGKITVSVELELAMVKFSVKDTGIGLEKENFQAIFEKFYEVQNAAHHSSGTYEFGSAGLGLGLALVKAILKAHHSTINIESTVGKGSNFSFYLPQDETPPDPS